MTARELAKAVRRAYRDRYGETSDRLDPDEAAEFLADSEAELGVRLPKLVRVVFTYAGRDFIELDWGVGKYLERYGQQQEGGRAGRLATANATGKGTRHGGGLAVR